MVGFIKTLALMSRGKLEDPLEVWNLIPPERNSLDRLMRISKRNKSWFSELRWEQRMFIEAVIRAIERIRSLLVLRVLAPFVIRLLSAIGKGNAVKGVLALRGEAAYRMMREVAQRLSRIAQRWGNKSAAKWPEDIGFIQFLITMDLYKI